MVDVPKKEVSFSWATRREGNDGYVLETSSDGEHKKEFGPMPAASVPAFIQGRRTLIAAAMRDLGANKKSGIIFQ